MKKNKMMRIASFLLVAVLMSTSAISGTFAKYVTTASASDTARVAKWGITMDSTGASTFVDTYQSGSPATDTVDGTDADIDGVDDDVVAPGTSGSVTYKVDGAPETAYDITFTYDGYEEVFLGKDKAFNYVDTDGKVTYVNMGRTLTEIYYPIECAVTITAANGDFTAATGAGDYINASGVKEEFDNLQEALNNIQNTKITYTPNESAELTILLEWNWPYYLDADKDAYDTILGDIAASNTDLNISGMTDGTDYNLDIAYTLTMTATQID